MKWLGSNAQSTRPNPYVHSPHLYHEYKYSFIPPYDLSRISMTDKDSAAKQPLWAVEASIESRTDTYPKSRDFIDLALVDSRRGHVLKLRIVWIIDNLICHSKPV